MRWLVEQRKLVSLRQVDVAERMGVSKTQVSHIEHRAAATIELLARYLDAIGGRLEITAAFDGGTERVVLDWSTAWCPVRSFRPASTGHDDTAVAGM